MAYVCGVVSLLIAWIAQFWLSQYASKHYAEWLERKIHLGALGIKKTLIITNSTAVVFGVFAFLYRNVFNTPENLIVDALLIPYAVSLVMWVGVMSAMTDVFSLKVPMDIAVRGYWSVFPVSIAGIIFSDDWQIVGIGVLAFWVWAMFLYFFFAGGFGQADVRMMILHAFGLVWWIGVDWVFYAFLAACILQIAFHMFSGVIRIGKRRAYKQRYNKSIDKLPPNVEVYDENPEFAKIPQKRSYLPLVPALTLSYTVLIIVSLVAERTGCSAYGGFLCM